MQGYKESEDRERAGWYEEKIGSALITFIVFLKTRGILECDDSHVDSQEGIEQ